MTLQDYFAKYEESHSNPTNIWLHHICIPLIGWSVLAFAHTFPVTDSLRFSHFMAVVSFVYYLRFKNLKLMALILISMFLGFLSFEILPHLRNLSLAGFVLGWIGQLYGHSVEGKKPAFIEEMVYIMIGPVWIFRKFI